MSEDRLRVIHLSGRRVTLVVLESASFERRIRFLQVHRLQVPFGLIETIRCAVEGPAERFDIGRFDCTAILRNTADGYSYRVCDLTAKIGTRFLLLRLRISSGYQ